MKFILKLLIYTLLLFSLILAIKQKNETTTAICIIVFILFALGADYINRLRENPNSYLKEKMIFNSTSLIIGSTSYDLINIDNLRIEINEYDREVFQGLRSKTILNGTKNYLKFTNCGKSFELKFYINSEFQKLQFKELFENWYRNKFHFIESNKSGRTYLLEYLTYPQIQEFKKKYGLHES